MELTQVNLDSFNHEDISSLNPNKNTIQLGHFNFPVQIKIEETGQTIMQEICLKIFQLQVSEIEQVK